jgi:hypothetical protein
MVRSFLVVSCTIACMLPIFAGCGRTAKRDHAADRQPMVKWSASADQESAPFSSDAADEPDMQSISVTAEPPAADGAATDSAATSNTTTDNAATDAAGFSPELLEKIRGAVASRQLVESELAAVMTDEELKQPEAIRAEVPRDGGLLIGFDLHWDGEASCMIDSMRPIYLTAMGEIRGEQCGGSPYSTLKAKPGFAVGAVFFRATNKNQLVRGFYQIEIVYMRIKGTRLDPSDSYNESYGFGPHGDVAGTLGGNGAPVVGVRLAPLPPFKNYIVGAFGLIQSVD